jgi:hypothetical protein
MDNRHTWSDNDKQFLKNNINKLTYKQIKSNLEDDHPIGGIRSMARRLGVYKTKERLKQERDHNMQVLFRNKEDQEKRKSRKNN